MAVNRLLNSVALLIPATIALPHALDAASPWAEEPLGRWPDHDALHAVYAELFEDNDWRTPSQALLNAAESESVSDHHSSSNGGVYTKWAPKFASDWMSYREFVGNKETWADQMLHVISVVTQHGLQESHMLLDVGCGALRAGKLLISFLQRGHYHCVEPNRALVQDAIKLELGLSVLQRKLPVFAFNSAFRPPHGLPTKLHVSAAASVHNATYNIILANSIFTHTARDLFVEGLRALSPRMGPETRLLATFFLDEGSCPEAGGGSCVNAFDDDASGWYYGGGDAKRDRFVRFDEADLTTELVAHGLAWERFETSTEALDGQSWLVIKKICPWHC